MSFGALFGGGDDARRRVARVRPVIAALIGALLIGCDSGGEEKVEVKEFALLAVGDSDSEGWPAPEIVATNSIFVKSSAVVRANVAVTKKSPGPFLDGGAELSLGAGAKIIGNVWADSLVLSSGSMIQGRAAYNTKEGKGTLSVPGETPLPLPLDIRLPPTPPPPPGGAAITIKASVAQDVAPGTYGALVLRGGKASAITTATFSGGLYRFTSIDLAAWSRVTCASPCQIQVRDRVSLAKTGTLGPASSSGLSPAKVAFTVLGKNGGSGAPATNPPALEVKAGATLRAFVFVPNGTADVAKDAEFEGKLVARDISLGAGVEFEGCEASDASCNGVDDDCDGLVDEDFLSTPTTCGLGVCAKTGALVCRSGSVANTCVVGVPSGPDTTCNGVDEDCDGVLDDGFVPVTKSCGVGACASTGETACVSGREVGGCVPKDPAPNDLSCDGIDNDCSGAVDEDFVSQVTSCGVGACARVGALVCASGLETNTCVAGVPAANDATCDGVDDDCNGAVDEGFPATTIDCGVGACARTGARSCQSGVVRDVCVPGTPATSDASCDGIDDDCDGLVDEDFVRVATQCGVGACVATGERLCVGGAVKNTCTPLPGDTVDATCDGVDDDCNGESDEDYVVTATVCGNGSCQGHGSKTCSLGQESDSCASTGTGIPDTICDGIDSDCDGSVDEDYVSVAVNCGIGACANQGQITCHAGSTTNTCAPKQAQTDDRVCDGIDSDCDGSVDEDFVPEATSCGVGACRAVGMTACNHGTLENSCRAGAAAENDAVCNGIDDDCDGTTDEDFVSSVTSCGVGACERTGNEICEGGAITSSCHEATPAALDASCDGIDDDCDGSIDEDFVETPSSCGVGACAAEGRVRCVAGKLENSCSPGVAALSDASCDGVDSDCDGQIDEGYASVPTECGIGACHRTGEIACVSGREENSCRPGAAAELDTSCDGIDDDCDGEIDEDFVPEPRSCGLGVCAATASTYCVDGRIEGACVPLPKRGPDTGCDGLDDDCDGVADDEYSPTLTSCGRGVCSSTGEMRCVSGALVDSCEESEPRGPDTSCDGVDDDCDGSLDEDFIETPTSCGDGACVATGQRICSGARVVDTCSPGNPVSSDSTCDGVDNDCNGSIDDGFLPTPTTCGLGACASTGTTICAAGILGNTCSAGSGATADTSCNGIDDDCDGFVDEDFVVTATSCGIGACHATGEETCVAGHVVDSCPELSGAPFDTSCNGIDDDCDGIEDEDFVPAMIACGTGACRVTTTTSCVDGVFVSECTEGSPVSDANCNGIDDDCDGTADDEFVPEVRHCGAGVCARTGATTCVAGALGSSCTPGVGAALDDSCNGVDDDCDESVDEDFLPEAMTCGLGICASSGQRVCRGGVLEDECDPGPRAADDSQCNGVDDDCDGDVDEDFRPTNVHCGIGACAANGATSCLAGHVENVCHELPAATSDATCNGIDDDCDGTPDEDFVGEEETCGRGACTSTGMTRCVSGSRESTCHPGTPALLDSSCNGVDDDCDGSVDEEFSPETITCGVGACFNSSVTSCEAGRIVGECNPRPKAPSDTTCNGVDDDCDGSVDEEFSGTTSECGVGACKRTGTATCVGGIVEKECTAGFPGMSDSSCDGIDDDCDGSVDEEFVATVTHCGIGACGADGTRSCQNGEVTDSCRPKTSSGSDTSCNGIDDDCDGSVDEEFADRCNGTAIERCSSGALVQEECGDSDVCNGVESCLGAVCKSGTPLDTSDENPCTVGSCDPSLGVRQSPSALGTSCGTGRACDGAGSCIGAPTLVSNLSNVEVSEGQPFTLGVSATGAQLGFKWFRNDVLVVGENGSTLSRTAAVLSDNGARYRVIVENAAGSVSSREATLTVGDSVGPSLNLLQSGRIEVTTDIVTVSGVTMDTGSGVQTVVIASDRFAGTPFVATLLGGLRDSRAFAVEVPLATGTNLLTVRSLDVSGNSTEATLSVVYVLSEAPRIQFVSPASGSETTLEKVDVAGILKTTLPSSSVRIRLGTKTVFPSGSGGEYSFLFESIPLSLGANTISVFVETSQSSVKSDLFVTRRAVGDTTGSSGTPPVIALPGISQIQFESSAIHRVSGTVTATTCVRAVTVNGSSVVPTGSGNVVSFSTSLNAPSSSPSLGVEVAAEDCAGRTTKTAYEVRFDTESPELLLSVPLAPSIARATQTPTRVSGTIREANLAGVSAGNQSVEVLPSGNGIWDFSLDVALLAGVEREVVFAVWDRAGRRTEQTVKLLLEQELTIEVISPAAGSKVSALESPVAVPLRVRVPGIHPSDRVIARVEGQTALLLSVNGEIASGQISVPLSSGAFGVTFTAEATDGKVKAQAATSVTLENANDIPLRVVAVSPEFGASDIEVSAPVVLSFNRPVSGDDLTCEVRETGQAIRYAQQSSGSDLYALSSARMENVVRNNEVVPSGISLLPGGEGIAVYPSRQYLYSGAVTVACSFEGEEFHRSSFTVRRVPTLIEGLVSNEALEPVANVEVSFPDASRSVVTDVDGNFSLGRGSIEMAVTGGRHRVVVNGGMKNARYGSFETFLYTQEGTQNSIAPIVLPLLDAREPFRFIESGKIASGLARGALSLDLTNARLTFENGADAGSVHTQYRTLSELTYAADPWALPVFGYAFQPTGVRVSGALAVEFSLPAIEGSTAYVSRLPSLVVLVGIDQTTLRFLPIGVAERQGDSPRLKSRGPVLLERLDVIAVAIPVGTAAKAAVSAYAEGNLGILELRGRLAAQ